MAVSTNSGDSVVVVVCYFLVLLASRRLLYVGGSCDSRADCRKRVRVIRGGSNLCNTTGPLLLCKGFVRGTDFWDDDTFVGVRAGCFSSVCQGKASKGETVGF